MKLYVMYNGLADDFPREAMACSGAPLDPKDCISIPTTTILIDHPKAGYILYDTGWTSREKLTFPTSPDEYIVNTLDRIGVKPEEIKYLILSHLHKDHAGNLEPFKNAEFIVSELEFLQVASLLLQNKISGAYVAADIEAWTKANYKWRLIREQYEVVDFVDGVKLISLGSGHAFGILALLVQLPKTGNIIIASDAIYGSINVGPPILPPGVIMDPPGWHKSLAYLQEKAKEYDAAIWYGHDLAQFQTLTTADEGYYE
ncbi:MAG: N-acyl homoserine lactonase family protein [Clostridiales Family XIII bacterium]|jgi:glyoxylase-like metal-dependent hydrolase (beta-lactamase superfamily II)|nr:N-acyl homoserine lactonase family protein [Clostridiales Family XIII bacterium]